MGLALFMRYFITLPIMRIVEPCVVSLVVTNEKKLTENVLIVVVTPLMGTLTKSVDILLACAKHVIVALAISHVEPLLLKGKADA